MKQHANTVDVRIKDFMKKKMTEFPELRERYGPDVRVVQRGYLFDDILGYFSKKGLI